MPPEQACDSDRREIPRFRIRLAVLLGLVVTLLVLGLLWSHPLRNDPPRPSGDPDPHGQLLSELSESLAALPAYVHQGNVQRVEPQWSSCDGQRKTYGWTDPTVVSDFAGITRPEATMSDIDKNLRRAGWRAVSGSDDRARYWTKRLRHGHLATIQLLSGSSPSQTWDFKVSTAPYGTAASGC